MIFEPFSNDIINLAVSFILLLTILRDGQKVGNSIEQLRHHHSPRQISKEGRRDCDTMIGSGSSGF